MKGRRETDEEKGKGESWSANKWREKARWSGLTSAMEGRQN